MLFSHASIGMVVAAAVYILALLFSKKLRQNSIGRKFLIFLFFVYIGAVVGMTMKIIPPWEINVSFRSVKNALKSINFSPIIYTQQIYHNCRIIDNFEPFITLVGGNFIMLAPLGILASMLNKAIRFWQVLLLACFTSLSIEGLQLCSNILAGAIVRTVEIDDFILNVSGCVLFYLVFAAARVIVSKRNKRSVS